MNWHSLRGWLLGSLLSSYSSNRNNPTNIRSAPSFFFTSLFFYSHHVHYSIHSWFSFPSDSFVTGIQKSKKYTSFLPSPPFVCSSSIETIPTFTSDSFVTGIQKSKNILLSPPPHHSLLIHSWLIQKSKNITETKKDNSKILWLFF